MREIHRENTAETLAENENSAEEMDYAEMYSRFVGDFIPGRSPAASGCLIGFAFLVLTMSLWCVFGWRFYQNTPTDVTGKRSNISAEIITAQKIRLVHRSADGSLSTAIPPWIHENIAQKIVTNIPPEHRSIYEGKQIEKLIIALKSVYWIQTVHSIRKYYPAYLEIEVTYRRPALLVAVREERNGKMTRCYIPVSQDCCILPSEEADFPVAKEELKTFPLFCGEAPGEIMTPEGPLDVTEFEGYTMPPNRLAGTLWDRDDCVRNAVQIVNLLGSRWEKFGLDYICLEPYKEGELDTSPKFCIATRNGSLIHWGKCVTDRVSKGDILDTEKITQLDAIYKKEHALDAPGRTMNISFRRNTSPKGKE